MNVCIIFLLNFFEGGLLNIFHIICEVKKFEYTVVEISADFPGK